MDINENSVLVFQGGKKSGISIIKNGRKYVEFRCKGNGCRYRCEKETGVIQVAPYWKTMKGLRME